VKASANVELLYGQGRTWRTLRFTDIIRYPSLSRTDVRVDGMSSMGTLVNPASLKPLRFDGVSFVKRAASRVRPTYKSIPDPLPVISRAAVVA